MELCIVCVLWFCIPIGVFAVDFATVYRRMTIEAAINWCVDPGRSPDAYDDPSMLMPVSDIECFFLADQLVSGSTH